MSDTLEIRNGHLQYGKTVIASNMSAAFLKPEIRFYYRTERFR